jgi:hypothetical protein
MPSLEPTDEPDAQTVPEATAPNGKAAPGTPPLGRDGKPKPKGLLPVPQEVIDIVDAYLATLNSFLPEDRLAMIYDYTLQWHYGGEMIISRKTERGYEVLASGDEVWDFLKNAPEEQKKGIVIDHPHGWDTFEA